MSIKHDKLYNWVQHNSSFYSVQLYDVKEIILEQKKLSMAYDHHSILVYYISILQVNTLGNWAKLLHGKKFNSIKILFFPQLL